MKNEFVSIVSKRLESARCMDEKDYLKRMQILATLPTKINFVKIDLLDYIRRLREGTEIPEQVLDYQRLKELAQQYENWLV